MIDWLIRFRLPLVCWRASNDNSFVIIVIGMMNRENNLSNIINTVTSWFKNEFFTIFKKKKIVYLSAPAAHDNNMIWMNELSRNLENILVGSKCDLLLLNVPLTWKLLLLLLLVLFRYQININKMGNHRRWDLFLIDWFS